VSVIETRELSKDYGGLPALKGVSVTVEKGQIYGLLGQNGAGKTTLIKILLGIVRKSGGNATLLGAPAGTPDVRRRVGYLPEDHQFPGYHTGYSMLDFSATMYGVSRDDRRRLIPESLELVGITPAAHKKIKGYSKGMKQRLGVAQALLHAPDVIFLDEPTDGVDPVGRREIRELMTRLKEKGHTIFLNSHLLSEIEMICDRVAILRKGELVREGTVADLTEQKGLFELGLAAGQKLPQEKLREMGYTVLQSGEHWHVTIKDGQTIDPVVQLIATSGLSLRHLLEKKVSLEDVFMAVAADAPKAARRQEEKK